MTDGRQQRQVLLPALRRFWALALVAGLAAGFAASWAVQSTSSMTWSGQATYIVPLAAQPITLPSGVTVVPDPLLPTNPNAASQFAESYSFLLVEDPSLLEVLGTATGEAPEQVGEQTSVLNVADSSIVRIGYSSDSEEQVVAFFAALETALQAVPAVTANIPSGNLQLLRSAQPQSDTGLLALAPVIGVLVALLIGLGLAVLLERLDPRLRTSGDLRELADWPVLEISGDPSDARTHVLVERALSAAPGVRSVAVVGVAGMPDSRVTDMADRLRSAAAQLPLEGGRVQWLAGSTLAGDGGAERLAQKADVVVVVAAVHARLRHLNESMQSLQDLVADPVLVALAPRERHRGTARDITAKDELDSWFEEAGEQGPGAGGNLDGSTADKVAGSR